MARRVTAVERVCDWARRHAALAALWSVVAVLVLLVAIVGTALSVSLARYNKTVLASADTLRHQLARGFAGSSQRLVENDDWLRALSPLAEAIRLGTGNPRVDRANRIRFAALIRSSPELRYAWADGRKFTHVEASADWKCLLLVTPESADLWDLEPRASLRYRWNAPQEWRMGTLSSDATRVVLTTPGDRYFLYDGKRGTMLGEGEGGISLTGAFGRRRAFVTFSGNYAVVHSGASGEASLHSLEHLAPVAWATNLPWDDRTLSQDTNGQLYLWEADGSLRIPPFRVRDSSEPLSLAGISATGRNVVLQGGKEIYLIDGFTGEVTKKFEAAGGPQAAGLDLGEKWLYLARRETGVDVREVETNALRFSAVHGALGFRGAFAVRRLCLARRARRVC